MKNILLLLLFNLIILACSNTKKGLNNTNELTSNNNIDSTKISNNVISDSNKVYYLDGKELKLSTNKSQSIKENPKSKKTIK